MPQRNEVESLQTVSARRVSWPDGINRKEIDSHPSVEQYCRDTIYRNYVTDNFTFLQKWLGIERLRIITNTIINTWIQLSNHHEASLAEFKEMESFMKIYPEVLDFLQEGITCTWEPEKNKDLFHQFILVVPRRSSTQALTAETWNSITNTLKSNEAVQRVKELCVEFYHVRKPPRQSWGQITTKMKFIRTYNFDETIRSFTNLTKLVVRGLANDDFLKAVGTYCHRIKHLDICKSAASFRGVRFLFFKDKDAEQEYIKRFKSGLPWNLPKHYLRPLTKTLGYFDMADMPNVNDDMEVGESILMACPHLVATPARLFFCPSGEVKIICKHFDSSPTLMPLRQLLILNVRSKFCEDIFYFVRGLLACSPIKDPTFQVRVDETGLEIGFLLFSDERLIAFCELENLTVINFTSYTKSTCNFIPVNLIGNFAPKLQRIKAPLKGTIGEKYPLKYLKHVAMPMAHDLATVSSVVKQCPFLQYLEVREILFHPNPIDDEDIYNMFERGADNLQTFRLLFKNKITLLGGLTEILRACPDIKMIGDFKYWAVNDKSFFRLHKQVNLHNFQIALEYDGVLYNSGTIY